MTKQPRLTPAERAEARRQEAADRFRAMQQRTAAWAKARAAVDARKAAEKAAR